MVYTKELNFGEKGKRYEIRNQVNLASLILFFLILTGPILSPFLFKNQVKASSLQTSVVIYICGNGIVEGPETCDDGSSNGFYSSTIEGRFCNTSCDGWAPYCGDGILQTQYGETCDDGNNLAGDGCDEVCQTEPAPPVSFGGGGGGETVTKETRVIIKGKAYPEALITLLQDGKVMATKKADDSANFRIEIKKATPGLWTFSLWAEDKKGRRSITFSFTATVIKDMTTTISGIFLPPTIELPKTSFKKGENLNIFGSTVPNAQVFVHIESSEIVQTTFSDEEGRWEESINTLVLEEGTHTARAKAKDPKENIESSFSQVLAFYVGEKVTGLVCPGADLNKDGRVNLIDFSILLYWWKRENPCADQNQDGIVNLPDFSIMLYYWTG